MREDHCGGLFLYAKWLRIKIPFLCDNLVDYNMKELSFAKNQVYCINGWFIITIAVSRSRVEEIARAKKVKIKESGGF